MVCQRSGRSCVPRSRGSAADKAPSSAAVMNPPPGPADEIKMQMKEKQGQSRFVRLQNPVNEFAVHRFVAKQDFYGFSPRPVNLVLADGFVAVAEVQTNESNELSEIVLGSGLSQIRNGHGSLPLMPRVLANLMTREHRCSKREWSVSPSSEVVGSSRKGCIVRQPSSCRRMKKLWSSVLRALVRKCWSAASKRSAMQAGKSTGTFRTISISPSAPSMLPCVSLASVIPSVYTTKTSFRLSCTATCT